MQIPFLDLKRQPRVEPGVLMRVLDSGRYIGGPELRSFEEAFAAYCGTAHCAGVANGTDAIEIALRAAGVQAGDEVATVANAGMYSTTAIRAIGAVPVYVDVDPVLLVMSPASLRAAIGPSTKAVVATHLYGRMAPMPELLAIAGGIPVIEDCAQAHGATLAGRRAGSWGLAGCYSFYPTKNLGAYGDAGAVVTNDAGVAGRVRALREYGWTSRFHSEVKGGRNSRMDEVQAALLGARLPLLDGWNARRREIARRYDEALGGAAAPERAGDVVHLYVFQCDGRDGLRERLRERGVATEVHYPIPDYRQASQSGQAFRSGSLAVTERCTARIVSLPCFPELTDDEVAYVVECLRAACGHGG